MNAKIPSVSRASASTARARSLTLASTPRALAAASQSRISAVGWTPRAMLLIGALAAGLVVLVAWFARYTHPVARHVVHTEGPNVAAPPVAAIVASAEPPVALAAPAPQSAPSTAMSARRSMVHAPRTTPNLREVVNPWSHE